MSDASAQLLGVLVGWVLGIGSHFIIDEVKRRREARETKAAVKVELRELQYRMAVLVFTVEARLGTLNRATLEWIRPIVVAYEGVYQSENVFRDNIDKFLALDDSHLALTVAASKMEQGTVLGLRKYPVPLLDLKLGFLSSFEGDTEFQSRLLEVRTALSGFYEDVDKAYYYIQLTFSSGISELNYKRAVKGVNIAYKSVVERAKVVAEHIGKLKW